MASPPTGPISYSANDTAEAKNQYLADLCNDADYLCSNKQVCVEAPKYTSMSDIDKECATIAKDKICQSDIKECLVQTSSDFNSSIISTSFVNILLPIKNEIDKNGNQKFLRLPALSPSMSPKQDEICNICSCVSRFAMSGTSPTTAPGQNMCEFPSSNTIETVYYPVDLENMNKKSNFDNPVKVGKYNIISTNIIYASSEEELEICNLYNLLIKNDIMEYNAVEFIKKLYKSDLTVTKQIETCIRQNTLKNKGNGAFYQNISFFYITFAIFLVLFVLVLI